MLKLHRLLDRAGFEAVVGDDQIVYSRGSEVVIVYFTTALHDPGWLCYGHNNHVTEGRGAAELEPLLGRTGQEAA
jgi:hypothetical protein